MISPETIAKIEALMREASVFEEDLEESFILGGGPGGQKTNKTSNVVRLEHEPSGISIRCGETRSRETNRWLARRMLAEEILDREHKRKSEARQKAWRRSVTSMVTSSPTAVQGTKTTEPSARRPTPSPPNATSAMRILSMVGMPCLILSTKNTKYGKKIPRVTLCVPGGEMPSELPALLWEGP